MPKTPRPKYVIMISLGDGFWEMQEFDIYGDAARAFRELKKTSLADEDVQWFVRDPSTEPK